MADCMSALHQIMFTEPKWYNKYNFVNDIGHGENGIYALRANLGFGDLDFDALKGFRSIESKLTGHGESHLYPDGVLLSNGPLGSSLAQAQGLAHADKLTGNDRTTIVCMSDGASMEGEAKESFSAIPGLAAAGKINPFVMIISDNNTKLSGRISEDSFDMTPSFASLKDLGWAQIKVDKGNDIQACYTAMEDAFELAKEGKPVFVWLKTVKGYGVKSTEEAKSGGHGFPVKAYSQDIIGFIEEILSGSVPEELMIWAKSLTEKPESKASGGTVKKEKVQAGLSRGLVKAAEAGKPVFSVSCDLAGSTGMSGFQKAFPDRFIDVGIAEANMVSHAAGLSKMGYIPVVDTFAAFGVTKGNLPFIMSALSSCPMIAVFSHTGFQDAADGASHQSLTYISAMSSIPHTQIHIVSCSAEAESLMLQAVDDIDLARAEGRSADSHIFFVGRENYAADIVEGTKYELGKAQILKEGPDGIIVSCGPLIYKAMAAAKMLEDSGMKVTVINNINVNSPDVKTIGAALEKTNGKLITVEDHQVIGGMGAQLVHALALGKYKFSVESIGVNGCFGQSAYTADQLYAKNGMDENGILKAFNRL